MALYTNTDSFLLFQFQFELHIGPIYKYWSTAFYLYSTTVLGPSRSYMLDQKRCEDLSAKSVWLAISHNLVNHIRLTHNIILPKVGPDYPMTCMTSLLRLQILTMINMSENR